MRKFEIISKKQFDIDFKDYDTRYDELILPKRNTKFAAGYDFYLPFDIELKPNEIIKIPTGIKVCMNEDEFLGIYVRSSLGFKYNLRLCNQVGIVDYDYYNNNSYRYDSSGHSLDQNPAVPHILSPSSPHLPCPQTYGKT